MSVFVFNASRRSCFVKKRISFLLDIPFQDTKVEDR